VRLYAFVCVVFGRTQTHSETLSRPHTLSLLHQHSPDTYQLSHAQTRTQQSPLHSLCAYTTDESEIGSLKMLKLLLEDPRTELNKRDNEGYVSACLCCLIFVCICVRVYVCAVQCRCVVVCARVCIVCVCVHNRCKLPFTRSHALTLSYTLSSAYPRSHSYTHSHSLTLKLTHTLAHTQTQTHQLHKKYTKNTHTTTQKHT